MKSTVVEISSIAFAGVASAALIFVGAGLSQHTGQPQHEAPASTRTLSAQEESDLELELAQEYNVEIDLGMPKHKGREDTAISSIDAIAYARDALGFGASDGTAAAGLVSFADPNYGPEVSPGPGQEKVVQDPTFVNVPAYAVTFSGVELPTQIPDEGAPLTEGVAFIDAESGAFLEFFSLSSNN